MKLLPTSLREEEESSSDISTRRHVATSPKKTADLSA